MKDKLGVEIKAGDIVAFIEIDCSFASGGPSGRPFLQTGKVIESASFGVLVQMDGGASSTVVDTKRDIVIIQMKRTEPSK